MPEHADFWALVAVVRAVRAWRPRWPADDAGIAAGRAVLRTIDAHRRAADAHERLAAVELMTALALPGLDEWLSDAAGDEDAEVRARVTGRPDPFEAATTPTANDTSAEHDDAEMDALIAADPDRDAGAWGRAILAVVDHQPLAAVDRAGDALAHRHAAVRNMAALLLARIPPTSGAAWRHARRRLAEKALLDGRNVPGTRPLTPALIRQAAARLITPQSTLDPAMLAIVLRDADALTRATLDPLSADELDAIVNHVRATGTPPEVLAALETHRVERQMLERVAVPDLLSWLDAPLPQTQPPARRAATEAARRLLERLDRADASNGCWRQLLVTLPPRVPLDEPPDSPAGEADAVRRLAAAEPVVRAEAALWLATTQELPAVTALLRRLGDADVVVRRAVVDALTATPRPAAMPALHQRVGDPRTVIRGAVAVVLAAWSRPEAIDDLLTLAADADAATADAAVDGLARLHRRGALPDDARDRLARLVRDRCQISVTESVVV